ncbi:hypothetical protein [Nostoc sp.]|uniref:hypothetical protein n=1 Tax=Nostoc sp. TaxID=1180 RepID=UPI002FF4CEEA
MINPISTLSSSISGIAIRSSGWINALDLIIAYWALGIGHGALGMGHWALGMGHWAWGIGHGAWGIEHWAIGC